MGEIVDRIHRDRMKMEIRAFHQFGCIRNAGGDSESGGVPQEFL